MGQRTSVTSVLDAVRAAPSVRLQFPLRWSPLSSAQPWGSKVDSADRHWGLSLAKVTYLAGCSGVTRNIHKDVHGRELQPRSPRRRRSTVRQSYQHLLRDQYEVLAPSLPSSPLATAGANDPKLPLTSLRHRHTGVRTRWSTGCIVEVVLRLHSSAGGDLGAAGCWP
jgi:hypothetical protein